MSDGDLFEQAMKRPSNYHKLSSQDQWEIDKRLGILDWNGSCPHLGGTPCTECKDRYWKHHPRRSR